MVKYESVILLKVSRYEINKILNNYAEKGWRLHSSSICYAFGNIPHEKVLLVFEREV